VANTYSHEKATRGAYVLAPTLKDFARACALRRVVDDSLV
jgi:hypothetical protein